MTLPALPPAAHTGTLPPSKLVMICAGAGAAACGLAGAYPRFGDSALLRLAVGGGAAVFGALVLQIALRGRTRVEAVLRALGMATVLGVATTIVPSAIVAFGESHGNGPGMFMMGLFFGALFGAPTGFFYGIFLAALAGMTWKHVLVGAHESGDRAKRVSGLWLAFIGLMSLLPSLLYDVPQFIDYPDSGREVPGFALPLSLVVSAAAIAYGVVSSLRAHLRVGQRRNWLHRVRDGVDGSFRLRDLDPRDDTRSLPVLTPGLTVVEWVPDAQSHTAYRDAPHGVAVALVAERPIPAR